MMKSKRWSAAGRGTAAGLLLAAGCLCALPHVAAAGPMPHDPWKLAVGRALSDPLNKAAAGRCENCHTLIASQVEPRTNYINNAARTMQSYKIALKRPLADADNLGCTFCHSTRLDNPTMDDVLSDFEFTTVKHPLGSAAVTHANNNNEYLSGFGSPPLAGQLQCLDCHLAEVLGYPYHEGRSTDPGFWRGTWDRLGNAYALRGVRVAADSKKAHCLTCHADLGADNGPTRPKMGHLSWGNYDAAKDTMQDASGRLLQERATADCVVCHDTHTSTKANLIQDGLDRGTPDGQAAIVESNCVEVCHQIGEFAQYGHGGKTGINAATCTPCHSASISHRDTTDASTVRRLGMLHENSLLSSLTLARDADGLDNDMNGVKDDETRFAYSKTSICKTCHMNYAGHGSGARVCACLDCHDMHGDAAVGNAAMIRTTLYGEATTFTAEDRAAKAYYRGAGDASGVCDNDACHGSIAGGLETTHSGGTGDVLAQPCTDCHVFSHKARPNTEETFTFAPPAAAAPAAPGPK